MLKMRKHRNARFDGHICTVLLRVDTPTLHDEVTNNHQSVTPSSTSNTAFKSVKCLVDGPNSPVGGMASEGGSRSPIDQAVQAVCTQDPYVRNFRRFYAKKLEIYWTRKYT